MRNAQVRGQCNVIHVQSIELIFKGPSKSPISLLFCSLDFCFSKSLVFWFLEGYDDQAFMLLACSSLFFSDLSLTTVLLSVPLPLRSASRCLQHQGVLTHLLTFLILLTTLSFCCCFEFKFSLTDYVSVISSFFFAGTL